MIRRRLAQAVLVSSALVMTQLAMPSSATAATKQVHCQVPKAGKSFETVDPAAVALDPAKLRKAVAFISSRNRVTVRVFRNNCLVGQGPLTTLVDGIPYPMFSVTKSVVSLLVGIAERDHKIDLNAPIGRYLPKGKGWGDKAHRQIKVRHLLTQTSGMDEAIIAEAGSTGLDPNLAREALAQPIEDKPGTRFRYSQLGPALLAFVLQRAVKEELYAYAKRKLFEPVGIRSSDHLWLRDRSGMVYGYSNLFLKPAALARLGLLVENKGKWGKRQVVPSKYLRDARRPTKANGCYGYLFWTNAAKPCIGAGIPAALTVPHRMVRSAPSDMFQMNGTAGQLNIIVPSLGIVVTSTGLFGDLHLSPTILLGASAGDMQHEFFRLLMSAVQDKKIADPGRYTGPAQPFDIDLFQFVDPMVLLRDLFPDANCNVLLCR